MVAVVTTPLEDNGRKMAEQCGINAKRMQSIHRVNYTSINFQWEFGEVYLTEGQDLNAQA